MAQQKTQNVIDGTRFWSIDRAALHTGFARATIERYVREGLPVYVGGFVERDAFLKVYRDKQQSQRLTRLKRGS
ncbi:hypothetical protein [Subtercola vilae]|uniref:DNA-binding protein n=1 Tax=Subtercola vilae TaxID=2056433 RepID=A0A4T2BWM1_9MICO|nr:hypothetical protein [Subtercola vilae]TIH34951.1 hypothetical protein D4765_11690 [Subtercola vilae]